MTRFLQSSSSAVAINENDALQEQGIATVTCLLSAAQVFHQQDAEQAKLLRLVKGIHALHIYSTEYWTEYILANAAVSHGLEAAPVLVELASRLAEALHTFPGGCHDQSSEVSGLVDDRLCLLDRLPDIKVQVKNAMLSRSLQRMESEILDQKCKQCVGQSRSQPF